MESKTFGYIRVSTREQNEERQIEALRPYVQDERDLFIDKRSGKDFDRPQYQAMKALLRSGDTVVVESIDRLGRNYSEILNEWREMTCGRGCHMVVVDMPLLDTREKIHEGGLTGKLIADLVLQILAYVAEKERESIKCRQAEGIAVARKSGVRFGRPKIEYPENFEAVYLRWKAGQLTAVKSREILGLKNNTFYRLVHEFESTK